MSNQLFTRQTREKGLPAGHLIDISYAKNQSTLADNLGIPLVNRFMCLLNAPVALGKNGWLEIQVIEVACPALSVEVGEQELNGIRRTYMKNRSDGDLQITFLESSDLQLRRFFYNWMQLGMSISKDGGVRRSYLSEFAVDEFMIAPLSYDGTAYYGDRFMRVYPVNVMDLNYNYATNGEIVKTIVNFKYMLHDVVSVTTLQAQNHEVLK